MVRRAESRLRGERRLRLDQRKRYNVFLMSCDNECLNISKETLLGIAISLSEIDEDYYRSVLLSGKNVNNFLEVKPLGPHQWEGATPFHSHTLHGHIPARPTAVRERPVAPHPQKLTQVYTPDHSYRAGLHRPLLSKASVS